MSFFGGKWLGFVSDGVPSMVDKNIGIAGKLKNKMEEFKGKTASLSFQCILHQALYAEFENESCKWAVVKIVNFIRAGAFNYHEVVALLEDIESDYGEIRGLFW